MPLKIYPVNLILVALILLPNLLFIVFPPSNIPTQSQKSGLWVLVTILEWIGRLAVFTLPLFWELKIDTRGKGIILIFMTLCILFYYTGWIKYMIGGREFKLLFEPLFFIPVPMAVFPVLYLILAGILLYSWPVSLAAIIFGVFHILGSLRSYNM